MLDKLRAVLITAPLIAGATALMGSISLLISLLDSSGRGQHRVARAWSRMLLRISGVKVHVEGLEKIAPGGSYVFVANHRSYMDVPVILPHISVQFRFLANKNLFSVPFIGYHLKRAGHLPVNNADARESLRSMTEAARSIRQRGISVLVFPEGGRTHGELRPFKDGAAYIAIKAGVPAVPVYLEGVRDVLPMGSMVLRGGEVHLQIGDPIATVGLSLQDRTRLSQQLHDWVAGLQSQPATGVVSAS
jgi:1-acyl-sn-glycerol-3-phosphate acyltransferase